jgi:hypothetical protein
MDTISELGQHKANLEQRAANLADRRRINDRHYGTDSHPELTQRLAETLAAIDQVNASIDAARA